VRYATGGRLCGVEDVKMMKVMARTKYHIGKCLIRFNSGPFGVSGLNFSTERL
jgi:hypothetical protein